MNGNRNPRSRRRTEKEMDTLENTEIIMEIIANGGNARSKAMKAIQLAQEGKFDEAKQLIGQADEDFLHAHRAQTGLIQEEVRGKKTEVSLLMVHAQDHLMNALTVRDLAKEIITLYETIEQLKKKKAAETAEEPCGCPANK